MKKLMFVVALGWSLAGLADGNAAHEAYQRSDYATALREFRILAEAGDAVAQYNLGLMYGRGEGVAADDAEALKWFRLAAQQGDADAQFGLGGMYHQGRGTSEDYGQALSWWRMAAGQGQARAQYALAVMYFQGQGVPRNDVRAYAWFELSAARLAAQGLDKALEFGELLGKRMTSAQIAAAQKLRHELCTKIPDCEP